jgi:PAS domain S-box-containing protein
MNDTRHSDTATPVDPSGKTFETVFEYANDAIFIVDIENDAVVDCNPAAVELVEYSREELLSMPASDLHPHNLSRFMTFADRVLEEGEGWTDDITCYCKSGDIIPAEMSASVIELDGRPHLVNHIRETSDREEREWFETLLEHSGDLITVMKHDGTIRYQSDSVEKILGYSPDGLRDESYFEYIHPDDRADIRESLETMASRSGGVVNRLEYRFRRADGSWAWIEGIVSDRPESVISGFLINARDITARKESQQQATVLNRILRHNLRNGLTVILGRAKLLAENDSERVASGAETILSSASDLQRLTTYTKDLSDMIGTHDVAQHRHDVTALLETKLEALADVYPDAEFDLDVTEIPAVMAAPKLDLAVEHVLTNAVEHNDSDTPHVAITARLSAPSAEYVELTVADNGPGIPRQEREVLLEGDEEPLKHGSGLGLWIVNWIVTRSGGYIEFDTNDPRGSRVTVYLPPAE